jgi:beta-lactamase family protein
MPDALRRLGDNTTDVDRDEPDLNNATPGDTRGTSTARALTADLRDLLLGDVLPASRRQLLTGWMLANPTGGPYIRAGVPQRWKVADKTGNGDWGTRNDIAVAWPPSGAPVVITVLSSRGSANAASQDDLLADATKAAVTTLGRLSVWPVRPAGPEWSPGLDRCTGQVGPATEGVSVKRDVTVDGRPGQRPQSGRPGSHR